MADTSHDQELRDGLVKGKGGVFKLTAGLQKEFGSDRVYNARLAEAGLTEAALKRLLGEQIFLGAFLG